MRVLRAWAGRAATTLALLMPVGCGNAGLPSYRYRLTVEVATPEGPRRGSSVIAVRAWQSGPHSWPNPGSIYRRVEGEAVAIELGRRGHVFAILRAGNVPDWPANMPTTLVSVRSADPYAYRRREIAAVMSIKGVRDVPRTFLSGPIPFQNWPDLVAFRDPRHPESIVWLPPGGGGGAYAGVALRRVTIEIVDTPVTRRITRLLPWLDDPEAASRLPVVLERDGDGPFIPPLTANAFTRSDDR